MIAVCSSGTGNTRSGRTMRNKKVLVIVGLAAAVLMAGTADGSMTIRGLETTEGKIFLKTNDGSITIRWDFM